jgi:hypothetical protein
LEVLHDIKRNRPATIVIIFTNYPFPQYRQKYLEDGAEFFFDKTSELNRLRETLEHLSRDFLSRAPNSTAGIRGDKSRSSNRLSRSLPVLALIYGTVDSFGWVLWMNLSKLLTKGWTMAEGFEQIPPSSPFARGGGGGFPKGGEGELGPADGFSEQHWD